jgi:hypothetical protein
LKTTDRSKKLPQAVTLGQQFWQSEKAGQAVLRQRFFRFGA